MVCMGQTRIISLFTVHLPYIHKHLSPSLRPHHVCRIGVGLVGSVAQPEVDRSIYLNGLRSHPLGSLQTAFFPPSEQQPQRRQVGGCERGKEGGFYLTTAEDDESELLRRRSSTALSMRGFWV
mmetsp:Transcript_5385/g.8367  ORF Transcript_5385/g.8367 Transcript_5385/m.8367 type:complete len:123 (+) Transcript_5385:343-711(+)